MSTICPQGTTTVGRIVPFLNDWSRLKIDFYFPDSLVNTCKFQYHWWFMLLFCFRCVFWLWIYFQRILNLASKNFLLLKFPVWVSIPFDDSCCCFASDCFVPLPLWRQWMKSSQRVCCFQVTEFKLCQLADFLSLHVPAASSWTKSRTHICESTRQCAKSTSPTIVSSVLLFCFRLFCSPSSVASMDDIIHSAPWRPWVKSSIVSAALFVPSQLESQGVCCLQHPVISTR